MTESAYVDASISPDADSDDILLESQRAGREATMGFPVFWPSRANGAYPGDTTATAACCPSCGNTKLLEAIDHRQQRNAFCPDCGMCWHGDFGQLRRVGGRTRAQDAGSVNIAPPGAVAPPPHCSAHKWSSGIRRPRTVKVVRRFCAASATALRGSRASVSANIGTSQGTRGRMTKTDQRGSIVIERPECLRLLIQQPKKGGLRRLGIGSSGAPHIIPVNFSVFERKVIVRIGPGLLADHLEGMLVAFEVDHAEPGSKNG